MTMMIMLIMFYLYHNPSDDDDDDDDDGENGAVQNDAFRVRSKAMHFARVPKRGPHPYLSIKI